MRGAAIINPGNAANVFGYSKNTKHFLKEGGTHVASSGTFNEVDPQRIPVAYYTGTMALDDTDIARIMYDYNNNTVSAGNRETFDPKVAQKIVTRAEQQLMHTEEKTR